VTAALLLWSVWQIEREVWLLQAANAERAKANQVLEDRLVAMTVSLNDAEEAEAALIADLGMFEKQSGRLGMLADLTRALPDNVWVSELSVNTDELRISGFAEGDATAVVEIVQQQTWATTVRLDGPIMYDSYTRQNRFSLWVGLTSAKLPE
jgi:Tfp pilus assembly protein PilN